MIKTVWPSGLRRWLKAPVRKGVGSNPTAVILTLRWHQNVHIQGSLRSPPSSWTPYLFRNVERHELAIQSTNPEMFTDRQELPGFILRTCTNCTAEWRSG